MYYGGISECDTLNGIGFRVVIFVSGCAHKCNQCHNSKTWNATFGNIFTEHTMDFLLRCLDKEYIDGITITGGDPLFESNLDGVLEIVSIIRKKYRNKTIWLYTGHTWEDIWEDNLKYKQTDNNNRFMRQTIINKIDVLVDGKYINSQRDISLKWRGSKNQRVIDVGKSLEKNTVVLYCN